MRIFLHNHGVYLRGNNVMEDMVHLLLYFHINIKNNTAIYSDIVSTTDIEGCNKFRVNRQCLSVVCYINVKIHFAHSSGLHIIPDDTMRKEIKQRN